MIGDSLRHRRRDAKSLGTIHALRDLAISPTLESRDRPCYMLWAVDAQGPNPWVEIRGRGAGTRRPRYFVGVPGLRIERRFSHL